MKHVPAVLVLCGVACAVFGVSLLSDAAALIVGGSAAVAVGLLHDFEGDL